MGDPLLHPSYEDKTEAKIIITLFCLVFLLIRFSMIAIGIWVVRNFGYGLKDKVYGKDGIFGDYWRDEEKTNWIVNDVNEEFSSTSISTNNTSNDLNSNSNLVEKEMDDFKKDSLKNTVSSMTTTNNEDDDSNLEIVPLD